MGFTGFHRAGCCCKDWCWCCDCPAEMFTIELDIRPRMSADGYSGPWTAATREAAEGGCLYAFDEPCPVRQVLFYRGVEGGCYVDWWTRDVPVIHTGDYQSTVWEGQYNDTSFTSGPHTLSQDCDGAISYAMPVPANLWCGDGYPQSPEAAYSFKTVCDRTCEHCAEESLPNTLMVRLAGITACANCMGTLGGLGLRWDLNDNTTTVPWLTSFYNPWWAQVERVSPCLWGLDSVLNGPPYPQIIIYSTTDCEDDEFFPDPIGTIDIDKRVVELTITAAGVDVSVYLEGTNSITSERVLVLAYAHRFDFLEGGNCLPQLCTNCNDLDADEHSCSWDWTPPPEGYQFFGIAFHGGDSRVQEE